jgi:hypothetical protein
MQTRQFSVAGLFGFVLLAGILCAAAAWIGIAASAGALLVQGMLLFERFVFPAENKPRQEAQGMTAS